MILTLFAQTEAGADPSEADLMAWADRFDHDFPVLNDFGYPVGGSFVEGSTISLPSMSLIAPGGEGLKADAYVTEADIEAILPW